jgi:hypothetical protein
MYSTEVYIYQQLTRVLALDSTDPNIFTYRYNPVYSKILTINKGVDNVLLFQFVNQNEKPVNVTGSTFMFRLLNTEGTVILLEQPMVILNGPAGQVKVTLSTPDLLDVLAQPASYSITRASGVLNEAVFTDAQSGARAPCNIVNSVLPQYVPSAPLTIPTVKMSAQGSPDGTSYDNYPGADWYWGGNPNGANYWNSFLNTEYYSSFVVPKYPVTTVQMTLDGYTGTIKAQAAEDYQSVPYNVPLGVNLDNPTGAESITYYNYTGTIYLNIIGWYPLVRLCFNNSIFAVPGGNGVPAQAYAACTDGMVTNITVQNAGQGYLAPPKINIVGDGAGATAEATISDTGSIESITVTNGGSGYWLMPNAGINTPYYPVAPSQQGAMVIISTGYVLDLFYR